MALGPKSGRSRPPGPIATTCSQPRTQRYDGDPAGIRASVDRLIDELLSQGLLVEVAPASGPDRQRLPDGRVPFADPQLHTYTDMQEFMLVDPLHEVDEAAGWPHAKSA